MVDERPRPKYGEYATPQEQAAIMARSLPPVSPLLSPKPSGGSDPADAAAGGAGGSTPADSSRQVPVESSRQADAAPARQQAQPVDAPSARPSSSTSSAAAGRPVRRWDRVLSIALLGYGLFNVVASTTQYADLTGYLGTVFSTFGLGDYQPTGQEAAVGLTLNIVTLVLFLATALITVMRLRARRIAFWVPLVGGAVAVIVSGILLQQFVPDTATLQNLLKSFGS